MTTATLIALTALAAPAPQQYGVDDIVAKGFKDCRFEVRVVKASQQELKKINVDFAGSYRFSFMKAVIKEPFMVRLESTVDDTDIVYMLVGAKRTVVIPRVKVRHQEDLSKSPGKRQTTLDFGVITPALMDDLFAGKFDRVDRETGALVFDLTYQRPKYLDNSRQRVWVNKEKRYVEKRVWYNQEGRQMATFVYEEPKEFAGVWFPTRCTVRNVDNKVAGITEYKKLSVNVGVKDAEFKI